MTLQWRNPTLPRPGDQGQHQQVYAGAMHLQYDGIEMAISLQGVPLPKTHNLSLILRKSQDKTPERHSREYLTSTQYCQDHQKQV